MITVNLPHKHGGTIETITAIEHETYKGVASWEFRGRVTWADGTVSESAHIAPWAVCCDNAVDEQLALWRKLSKMLHDYLDKHGEWHDAKHKRDGRVYNWTPKKPKHSEEVHS